MNTFSQSRGNRLPFFPLLALLFVSGFFGYKSIAQSDRSGGNIYVVIKPQLSREILEAIANRLKEKSIEVTYRDLGFEEGRLTSIDVTIDVAIPGKPRASYALRENGNSDRFQPLVFYCESDGERVGFVKGIPDELSAKGKRLVNENLVGLLIQNGDDREIIGHWQSN